MISANALGSVTRTTLGNERIEILEVPNIFKAPEAVVRTAETQSFQRINPHYPGLRAGIEDRLLSALCEVVSHLAAAELGTPKTEWTGQAWYSIVTQAPQALTPIQRMPHFDGFDESQMAVMIYLHRTAHGGTAFYRHKSTGFEQITEARYPTYKAHLEADVQKHGLPAAQYIQDGAPMFERIAQSTSAFNQLCLYPGTLLHSGSIDNQAPLPGDPKSGRLTINGFFRPA